MPQTPKENNISLSKFESMLKTNKVLFFDSEEFESIIIYYLESGNSSMANKAIKMAIEQYPKNTSILLLKVEALIFENNIEEAEKMLHVYADFVENYMALPVMKGVKTPNERFAGALETYCIEALMQDGKALQAGTSHFLGQNFAKAFDVKFLSKENQLDYVWGTSWGVSTRLMGALIMAHSDDQGLVLPPKLAPIQVVIVPIYKGDEQLNLIKERIEPLVKGLKKQGVSVKFDTSENQSPGFKFAEYELKGVPVRLAIGNRDMENGTIELARRDTREKTSMPFDGIEDVIVDTLEDIQKNIYQKAFDFRAANTFEVNSWEEFTAKIEDGGFLSAHWDGSSETEEKIKELTKATIRCIPLDAKEEAGKCILTGAPSSRRVIFARAY